MRVPNRALNLHRSPCPPSMHRPVPHTPTPRPPSFTHAPSPPTLGPSLLPLAQSSPAVTPFLSSFSSQTKPGLSVFVSKSVSAETVLWSQILLFCFCLFHSAIKLPSLTLGFGTDRILLCSPDWPQISQSYPSLPSTSVINLCHHHLL